MNILSYKTKNGRSVYDGGGVRPDIEVDEEKENELIREMNRENLIFDFANTYVDENDKLTLENFYHEFRYNKWFSNVYSEKNFDFETKTDQKIKELEQIAKTEEFFGSMESSITDLKKNSSKGKRKSI